VEAAATVVAAPGPTPGGPPRLVGLRSAAPLGLRWASGCLYVVGTAFAPLGGDRLDLRIVVEPGADLTVRTVAAAVALPGRHGAPSSFTVDVEVGAGGSLRWRPEPGIAATGARHTSRARITLAGGAALTWREEVLRGRHGETGGTWCSQIEATVDGAPLLAQETVVGDERWASPAVGGGARAAGALLAVGAVGPGADQVVPWTERAADAWAAVLPLERPGAALVSALAGDARTLRRLLDAGEQALAPSDPVVGCSATRQHLGTGS
jgi:urease accessory protein